MTARRLWSSSPTEGFGLLLGGPYHLTIREIPPEMPDPLRILPEVWPPEDVLLTYRRGTLAGVLTIYVLDGVTAHFEAVAAPLIDAVYTVRERLGREGIALCNDYQTWAMIFVELHRRGVAIPCEWGRVDVSPSQAFERVARAARQADRRAEQEQRYRLTRTGDILNNIDDALVAAHRDNNPADNLDEPWDFENFAPVDSDGGSYGDEPWPFASF